ncbi:MAG: acyl-CoA dehydrogenase [Desulfobacterales bacterium]|nr:acyl-CoA dehydrogenase [Desulfobacterales bacterium]
MAQELADRRDVDFVLFEQLDTEALLKNEKFSEFNKKTINLIVTEARKLAIKEILPTNAPGDREGCRFENGIVKVPDSFHRAFKLFCEGEWIAPSDDPEVGGQGLPVAVTAAVSEYFAGANTAFGMYPGLCHGAGKLVEVFGTDEQKALYLKKMYAGQWGGSMLLTEPEAGSDVGALTTTAVPNGDGTYSISGSKIFITGGEQDLTENIIHPVLARIQGAPEGTRGISLFLVPKIQVNPDGSLGEPNDVVCTGIEEKMGIHGSATCSLTLGGSGRCRGVLLGEENKGMRAMFHMMNEARFGVGLQALSMASAAASFAVGYAKERRQGKNLMQMMDPDAPQAAIIEHPDVRRMLIWNKAYVDGMRSFMYYTAQCFDRAEIAETEADREKYQGLVEILTPIIKAYCSERGFEVCSQAVQVYGGYGYTGEYPVEQYMRDCRITPIYEGTNGIQAMDLLGRKMGAKKGKYFMDLLGEMQATITEAKGVAGLTDLAGRVEIAVNRLGEVALHLGQTAMSPQVLAAFAFAHPFMMAMGDVILAWMHLWRSVKAAAALEKDGKNKQAAFYEGILVTARYFIRSELPVALGRLDAVAVTDDAAITIPDAAFGL